MVGDEDGSDTVSQPASGVPLGPGVVYRRLGDLQARSGRYGQTSVAQREGVAGDAIADPGALGISRADGDSDATVAEREQVVGGEARAVQVVGGNVGHVDAGQLALADEDVGQAALLELTRVLDGNAAPDTNGGVHPGGKLRAREAAARVWPGVDEREAELLAEGFVGDGEHRLAVEAEAERGAWVEDE